MQRPNVSLLTLAKRIIYCAFLLTSATSHANAAAANNWLLIDDFEANALNWVKKDTRNDTQPHVQNPQISEIRQEADKNHYLLKKPAAEGIVGNRKALTFKALPAQVELGETYTFYSRINVEAFPNNHLFGLSNLDSAGIEANDYNALEPSLRVTDKYESNGDKNDGTLMVKIGPSKTKTYAKIINPASKAAAKPLQVGTWYQLWYVVNNAKREDGGQRYDVYIKGGEFKKQTKVYSNADFRMQREQALGHFFMICNTGAINKPYGNGGLRYDDLYMRKGLHLDTPFTDK